MRVAIMQPTYLPWIGYFALMDEVDAFVFLDNVQFEKRSWQQRNRIKTAAGLNWLSVPVKSKGRFDQTVAEVELAGTDFVREHLASIRHAYAKAPHAGQHMDGLGRALGDGAATGRLADLNIALIGHLAAALGVATRRLAASSLGIAGRRSDLLAAIAHSLGATEYVSPPGSLGYLLEESAAFARRGIAIRIQQYEHPRYPQLFPPFVSHASAIDLLFNAGPGSGDILRAGRRPALGLAEAAAATTAAPIQEVPT